MLHAAEAVQRSSSLWQLEKPPAMHPGIITKRNPAPDTPRDNGVYEAYTICMRGSHMHFLAGAAVEG